MHLLARRACTLAVAIMPRAVSKQLSLFRLSLLGDADLCLSLSDALGFDFGELGVASRFGLGLLERCLGVAQNDIGRWHANARQHSNRVVLNLNKATVNIETFRRAADFGS